MSEKEIKDLSKKAIFMTEEENNQFQVVAYTARVCHAAIIGLLNTPIISWDFVSDYYKKTFFGALIVLESSEYDASVIAGIGETIMAIIRAELDRMKERAEEEIPVVLPPKEMDVIFGESIERIFYFVAMACSNPPEERVSQEITPEVLN
jgi:hypothetical protein